MIIAIAIVFMTYKYQKQTNPLKELKGINIFLEILGILFKFSLKLLCFIVVNSIEILSNL